MNAVLYHILRKYHVPQQPSTRASVWVITPCIRRGSARSPRAVASSEQLRIELSSQSDAIPITRLYAPHTSSLIPLSQTYDLRRAAMRRKLCYYTLLLFSRTGWPPSTGPFALFEGRLNSYPISCRHSRYLRSRSSSCSPPSFLSCRHP